MQYLVLTPNQSSMYKKIAIDLALLYVEWCYQDLKERVVEELDQEKKAYIVNQQFAEHQKDIREVLVSFFIKMAISSCQDKEEKENITRKALVLLKKWLIIATGTPIKYASIEKALYNLTSRQPERDGGVTIKLCLD